ncbi:MAG: uroporphyrinogen decarboxylase family protein [Bacteroidota bacterium]|nr:uroporphyrinogen decarboxylase family protein [Bacteroidota bacterium]
MSINMHKWAESVLTSDKRPALPIMTHPGIDLIGKNVQEAVTNGETHFEAIKALQQHYPMIAATMIMDLTVEAEAFGSPINFAPHEVPTVSDRIVSDFESVQNLNVPTLEAGRVSEYLKAATLAAQNITNVPVFAGCIGPFSLAGRLFDMTEIMTAAYIEPETIELLLQKCTEFINLYVKAFKKAGVGGVLIAEPAAGMLSEDMCQQFSSDYVKKIVDENQDETFMVILHNCGNTGHVTQAMVNTSAAGLHFGNKIDITQVLNEVPANILVLGNLDPVGVFKMGTSQSVLQATSDLLEKTKDFRNFVISSGCDTPPGVPVENIEAFFGAIK